MLHALAAPINKSRPAGIYDGRDDEARGGRTQPPSDQALCIERRARCCVISGIHSRIFIEVGEAIEVLELTALCAQPPPLSCSSNSTLPASFRPSSAFRPPVANTAAALSSSPSCLAAPESNRPYAPPVFPAMS